MAVRRVFVDFLAFVGLAALLSGVVVWARKQKGQASPIEPEKKDETTSDVILDNVV
jgi:uncharacterized iron-regulated membrane protein